MRIRHAFHLIWILPVLAVAAILTACSKTPDERIAQMAQQSLDTQARQNERLVQQNQQVIEASKELVAKDAQARQEMANLQHDFQADQHEVGKQRDVLEQERRQIAEQRFRDQAVSGAITTVGLLLVAALPLAVAIYMLRAVRHTEASDATLTEVLVDELLADKPRLLPRPAPMQIDADKNLFDSQG